MTATLGILPWVTDGRWPQDEILNCRRPRFLGIEAFAEGVGVPMSSQVWWSSIQWSPSACTITFIKPWDANCCKSMPLRRPQSSNDLSTSSGASPIPKNGKTTASSKLLMLRSRGREANWISSRSTCSQFNLIKVKSHYMSARCLTEHTESDHAHGIVCSCISCLQFSLPEEDSHRAYGQGMECQCCTDRLLYRPN